MEKKLGTAPYKGVRDFYPDDQAIQNYIFRVCREAAESFGYEEYGASILEPAELYEAKGNEEIVREQTYTFTDRGGRRVTLRPEFTPTFARLLSARRKTLLLPLRWFTWGSLYRYERTQRGRTREHWQFNADLAGVPGTAAEAEIIFLACAILKAFGLPESAYEVRLNSREIMNYILSDLLSLPPETAIEAARLIDRREKVPKADFEKNLAAAVGEKNESLLLLLYSKNFEEFASRLPEREKSTAGVAEVRELIARLEEVGIGNVRFDQTLMRGFDYYTGMVFEIFDTSAENPRSLFGGGRYDELLSIFGAENLPAAGFGVGDVTLRDMLKTYNLLPPPAGGPDLYLAVAGEKNLGYANDLAASLRSEGVRVAVDLSQRKIGDQLKYADKKGFLFTAVVGEEERESGRLSLKRLKDGREFAFSQTAGGEMVKEMAERLKNG
ncbi:MAG: histidine--tRNA ligase [Candidatus Taylorbacteria bacterium]|nr:histidine--tRNA ligase [Candidatus Taylorbacteria bacterium]